jgi:hypothetical protein
MCRTRGTIDRTLQVMFVQRASYLFYYPFLNPQVHYHFAQQQTKLLKLILDYFNAMNSVHFCSITDRSNQMHYFYYLKLKTIYKISL